MSLADHLLGVLLFAGTSGSALLAGGLLARRRFAHLAGAETVLAAAVLGIALVIAVHLLPGLFGVLSRWSALGVALALLAAVVLLVAPAAAARGDAPRAETPPSSVFSRAVAALAAGPVALWTLAQAWANSATPSIGIDTLTHHLPNVGAWARSGSFWQVDQFVPLLANGNYPQSGDVVMLAALLPWDNDAFVRLVDFPLVALAALAVYAGAVELGSPRATGVIFGALFASLPVVVQPAYEGTMTDPLFMAGFAAGLLFLLRFRRTELRLDLVLAGIAFGLAFGSKWYGITAVAATLAAFGALALLERRPAVRPLLALGTIVAAVGGFWLVRNWVESGNPFMPVRVQVAGLTVFDAARDYVRECAGFPLARYLTDTDALREAVWPAYRAQYALPGFVLLAGVIAALPLALRRPPERRVLALVALTGALAAIYSVTPYTALGLEGDPVGIAANARYLMPALVSGAIAAAWAVGRLGRARPVAEAIALLAVADGIRRGFAIERGLVAAVGLCVLLAAAAGWVVRGYVLPRLSVQARRAALVGALALGLAALAGAGHARQRDFNDARYFDMEAPVAWIAQNAPEGNKIGLAGVWGTRAIGPTWPAFGPRLGNEVEFVGPTVDGQLREYRSRGEFDSAVRSGGYDLLLIGSGGAAPGCTYPGPTDKERAWARELGYRPVAESEWLTLFRPPPA